VANGGATPADSTKNAIADFYNGLIADSLLSKMLTLNCIAPDNLIAATTPLIVGPGSDPWTNNGFGGTDITVNGLGNNSHNLNTGFFGTHMLSDTNVGLTLYVNTASPGGTYDFGYGNNSGSDTLNMSFNANGGGHAVFWCFNTTIGGGAIQSSSAPGGGYLSGNRTASNAMALYFANSTNSHASIATGSTSGGTRSAHVMLLGALNAYESGGAFGATTNKYSFCAMHEGLTSSESNNFYNRIQALRTAFGGGYR